MLRSWGDDALICPGGQADGSPVTEQDCGWAIGDELVFELAGKAGCRNIQRPLVEIFQGSSQFGAGWEGLRWVQRPVAAYPGQNFCAAFKYNFPDIVLLCAAGMTGEVHLYRLLTSAG